MRTAEVTKQTTEDPDKADRFNRVLGDTVEAMEDSGIQYVFIGGIASGGLGRPRSTHDIDLFVAPDDAELALRALAKKGFSTERTDPTWLYKAFKEGVLVDVIFKSKGDIYLDSEMYRRIQTAEFHGRSLKLVAPEDLLIIKAVAHSELTPGHWHDAIALLTHASFDWEYLLRRARRAPRRVLSLLLYAQSSDAWVPNSVIHELYTSIFGDVTRASISHERQGHPATPKHPVAPAPAVPAPATARSGSAVVPIQSHPAAKATYAAAHLREALAEDARTSELDIVIEQSGDKILLRGEVQHPDRKSAVEKIAREKFPDAVIENQIRILEVLEPSEAEEIR